MFTNQQSSFPKLHDNILEEINEMKSAMNVTKNAHCSAMAATYVGSHEQKIASVFNAVISQAVPGPQAAGRERCARA